MAYLNFQNCTRQEYENVIYSQDAKNKIKILFNNVKLENADRYCEKLTIKSRIVPNGAKIFSLNNFISKEAELILHDIDTSIIQDQVSISIGTLVGNSYEYVPIGIFNIENQPTNDKNKTTIKLRDNSVKFDFNYNAQPLIEENGGSATKLQILQDICTQAGVTCNITSFIGYLDEIGIYDNTVTARKYIADIAEQAGKIATINRSGELIFIDLNNLTTWEIPIEIVEKYESGTKFKVGKVVYEDGIVRYETPTSNDDTLFLDGSNNYINGELIKEQASSSNNSYYLENTSENNLDYFELEGKTTQETRSGKNLFKNADFNEINHDITFTNINNSLNISGTSTATYYPSVVMYADGSHSILNWVATTSNINAEKGYFNDSGDIIISVFQNGNRTGQQRIVIGYEDNTIDTYYLNSTDFATKTYTTNKRINFICIANHPSQTYNVTFKIMISKSGGEYEPYGIMPSPDNPSELVSVGYTNLFNKDDYNLLNACYIDGTGKVVYGYNNKLTWLKLQPNTTYTITQTKVSYVTRRLALFSNDLVANAQGTLIATFTETTAIEQTFTTTDTNVYLGWVYCNLANLNNTTEQEMLDSIQITQGTQAHSYIPYGKYGIEVKTTGKNLFDKNTADVEVAYINSSTGAIISGGGSTTIKYYPIQPNTQYTLSIGKQQRLAFYNSNKITVSISTTNNTTFTTPNDAYYVSIQAQTTMFDINTIQLEKGTQATTYEPYIGHTNLIILDNPLRSIGDTKDLLYIKNGMLYVDRKIGSVVLDGSENWRYYSSAAPYGVTLTDNKDFNSDSADFKTNYFENKIWSQTTFVDYNSLVSSVKPKELRFRYADISTLADFKTWLSTHNTEVQYVLATPSLEGLGVIEVPKTHEETTYIDISSNIDTNTYLQYRENKTQVEAILGETNQFDIDSLKTGKILGNPAIDSYDLIQIHDTYKDETYTTLATNDLVYTGVLINTFDTQIGEEAKEQNVFVNGEETFKKWARTKIDNVEGALTLQAGEINEVNGKINSTTLQINSQGALLDVLANKSNIDIEYDSEGNPLNGEVREVTTTTGFKFNAEGMTIEDSSSNFKALHRNDGTYYKEGDNVVGQYTKDGSKQKDLDLFGVYTYGKNSIEEIPMFVAQLYTDGNGEEGFGHFYNRGD